MLTLGTAPTTQPTDRQCPSLETRSRTPAPKTQNLTPHQANCGAAVPATVCALSLQQARLTSSMWHSAWQGSGRAPSLMKEEQALAPWGR